MASKYLKLNRRIHIITWVHSASCDFERFIPYESHGINRWMVKIIRVFSGLVRLWTRAQLPVHFRFLPSMDEKLNHCIFFLRLFEKFESPLGVIYLVLGNGNPFGWFWNLSRETYHVYRISFGTVTCSNIKKLIYKYQKCSNLSTYVCPYKMVKPYPFAH